MAKLAIGIDIGGTGIKAALVDTRNGVLASERVRLATPEGGEPEDIAQTVLDITSKLKVTRTMAVGVCFPAVVKHGVTRSAANVSQKWINFDAERLFEDTLQRHVHIMNDADAAGAAEVKFGAGRRSRGLVVMTTLGTGIGTALFYNGILIPNAELGHLEIDGVDYESKAAFSAKENEGLSFADWAVRLQRYYSTLERLLSPDLIIVGGGVSKHHEQFLPLLKLETEIVPARNRNNAGIIGAAAMAYLSVKD